MKLLEQFNHYIGLELNSDEAAELKYIDDLIIQAKQATFVRRDRINKLEHSIQITKDAYQAIRHATTNLNAATDKLSWRRAYQSAKTADGMIRKALAFRFETVCSGNGRFEEIFLLGLSSDLLSLLLFSKFMLNTQTFSQLYADIYARIGVTVLLLLCASNQIPFLLVPNSTTQKVLDKAQLAGIDLFGVDVNSPDSLISNLMTSVNNEEELNAAHYTGEHPNHMICPITLEIMTDPIGTPFSPHAFERAALVDWLKKKSIHPITKSPLSLNDLRRDFKLKQKIDQYVSCLLKANKVDRHLNKSKVSMSFFHQNESAQPPEQSGINSSLGPTLRPLRGDKGALVCLGFK